MNRRLSLPALTALLVIGMRPPTAAHPERDATFPDGLQDTPADRFDGRGVQARHARRHLPA